MYVQNQGWSTWSIDGCAASSSGSCDGHRVLVLSFCCSASMPISALIWECVVSTSSSDRPVLRLLWTAKTFARAHAKLQAHRPLAPHPRTADQTMNNTLYHNVYRNLLCMRSDFYQTMGPALVAYDHRPSTLHLAGYVVISYVPSAFNSSLEVSDQHACIFLAYFVPSSFSFGSHGLGFLPLLDQLWLPHLYR